MLRPDQVIDSLHAYQLAKRGKLAAGQRLSPGIIITPLADASLAIGHALVVDGGQTV